MKKLFNGLELKKKIISFLYSYDKVITLNPNYYLGWDWKGFCLKKFIEI